MPLNLASPGIVVREVDLTNGRIDPSTDKIGAIVAPFAKGPVNLPTLVQNEQELLNVFGRPYSNDKHYEHWLTASSFLAYGGGLRVVRAAGNSLTNALAGAATFGIPGTQFTGFSFLNPVKQFMSGLSPFAIKGTGTGRAYELGNLLRTKAANIIPSSIGGKTALGIAALGGLTGYLASQGMDEEEIEKNINSSTGKIP